MNWSEEKENHIKEQCNEWFKLNNFTPDWSTQRKIKKHKHYTVNATTQKENGNFTTTFIFDDMSLSVFVGIGKRHHYLCQIKTFRKSRLEDMKKAISGGLK